MHALHHGFCQLLLTICQQGFNLLVRIITDGVDLRGESPARKRGVAVEERLDPVVVLLEQRPDLLPLVRGEFQILGQVIELLVHRPGAVELLKRLMRLVGRRCFLG